MERKALGKGISALIPDVQAGVKKEEVLFIETDKIRPNILQPREHFEEQGIDSLAASIREKGVIQPLLVRRKGDSYELIAGERRLRAAQLLNLKDVPVIVKAVDDQDSLELALIENIQRENLNPIEEAHAYQYLLDQFQLTQERIGEVLGKARVTITNTLRLLKLPKEIQEEIKQSRISYGHGRALLEIDDPQHQRRLVQEVISKGLSVRELETKIKAARRGPRRHKGGRPVRPKDALVSAYEETLQHALATKVRIEKRDKRGTIEIEFYSQSDLDRIVTQINNIKLDK